MTTDATGATMTVPPRSAREEGTTETKAMTAPKLTAEIAHHWIDAVDTSVIADCFKEFDAAIRALASGDHLVVTRAEWEARDAAEPLREALTELLCWHSGMRPDKAGATCDTANEAAEKARAALNTKEQGNG